MICFHSGTHFFVIIFFLFSLNCCGSCMSPFLSRSLFLWLIQLVLICSSLQGYAYVSASAIFLTSTFSFLCDSLHASCVSFHILCQAAHWAICHFPFTKFFLYSASPVLSLLLFFCVFVPSFVMYLISVFLRLELCSGKHIFGFNSCEFYFFVFI